MDMDNESFFSVQELAQLAGVNISEPFSDDDESMEIEENIEFQDGPVIFPVHFDENVNSLEHVPSSSSEVFHGNFSDSRKRNKKAKPGIWACNKNKILRMQGQECTGRRKNNKISMKAKEIGNTCQSEKCLKSKLFFCSDFSEEVRNTIFETYWRTLDWNQKRTYVTSLIDAMPKRVSKTTSPNSKRKLSHIYSLKLGNKKKRVCKRMFLSTLGVRQFQVAYWMKNLGKMKNFKIAPSSQQASSTDSNNEKSKFMEMFLLSLPKLPSHYCRASSTKLYLEPIYQSKAELYKIYQQKCISDSVKYLARCTFNRMFLKLNLSLFTPKKDQCDVCHGYKVGNISESEYNAHIQRKQEARSAKAKDKQDSIDNKCHTLTMDLQAVKLSPFLKATAIYYKRKLIVHNFTVFDLKELVTSCFWWDESQGDLSASSFASCLCKYLLRYTDSLPIIIYSDGCTAQNRNAILSNALLHFSMKYNKCIVQKFLEKGHTQMEVDSVHSSIEVKLKNQEIYLPTDYINISRKARENPFPYDTYYLPYEFFTNFAKEESFLYPSIRPGFKKPDPCVTDIRELKYTPEGKIYFKVNYTNEWEILPHAAKKTIYTFDDFPQLHSNQLPISAEKWKDLQDLKAVIPQDFHQYYDTIPH